MTPAGFLTREALRATWGWIRSHWKLAIAIAIAAVLFGAGFYAAQRWFPRRETVRVDRVIEKAVPVPGKTVTIEVPYPVAVPGPTIVQKVPVEVTRIVEKPGTDRIITVTKPVPVPPEVILTWPQTITVRVGSVLLDDDTWGTPKFPDLLLGQVTPGVYAVSDSQPGWKIRSVETSTQVTPPVTLREPSRWTFAAYVGFSSSVGSVIGGEGEYRFSEWRAPVMSTIRASAECQRVVENIVAAKDIKAACQQWEGRIVYRASWNPGRTTSGP